MYHEAAGTIIAKAIGWTSIVAGPPVGMLMAAASSTPFEAGTWMAGGFAGLVAGYLLVWFIPRLQEQHNATLRQIAEEHRTATQAAVDGNTRAFNDAARANNESFNQAADKIVASHERWQRVMMRIFAKAAGIDISESGFDEAADEDI